MKRSTPASGWWTSARCSRARAARPSTGTQRMLDAALENNVVVADRLRALTVDLLGVPPGAGLDRAPVVAVEAADAVLKLAFRAHPDGDPELIAECKHLVRRYLSDHLPS